MNSTAHLSRYLFLLVLESFIQPRVLDICQMFQLNFLASPFYFIIVYDAYRFILKWKKNLVQFYLLTF